MAMAQKSIGHVPSPLPKKTGRASGSESSTHKSTLLIFSLVYRMPRSLFMSGFIGGALNVVAILFP